MGIGINPKLAARIKNADLILAIGPRLGEMTTSGYTLLEVPRPRQTLVHIHASAEELNRVYQADLAICATMNAAARSLEVLTAPPTVAWTGWTASAHADYEANFTPQTLPGDIDMPAIVATLQRSSACRCGADQRRWQLRQLGAPILPAPRPGQGTQDPACAARWARWATACLRASPPTC